MRILAGVFPPSSGAVTIAGCDVVAEPLKTRSQVGYFPERVSLYVDMTVEEYLRYVGRMKGFSAREARRFADEAIESCALPSVGRRIIGSLSKGFRQRVGIAQALVGNPRVLILDEPTTGLDPEQVAEMRGLVRGLRRDRTVILSTHILPEAEATCDRVIIIRRGRIVAVDTPTNLNQRLRREALIYIEVNGPFEDVVAQLSSLTGVERVTPQPQTERNTVVATLTTNPASDPREQIARAITERGWGLRELRPLALSLEEIFLSLVNRPLARESEERSDEDLGHLPT
jgi:ABC-2 type transport system ATP-binding protein